jgi:hypothetical protein
MGLFAPPEVVTPVVRSTAAAVAADAHPGAAGDAHAHIVLRDASKDHYTRSPSDSISSDHHPVPADAAAEHAAARAPAAAAAAGASATAAAGAAAGSAAASTPSEDAAQGSVKRKRVRQAIGGHVMFQDEIAQGIDELREVGHLAKGGLKDLGKGVAHAAATGASGAARSMVQPVGLDSITSAPQRAVDTIMGLGLGAINTLKAEMHNDPHAHHHHDGEHVDLYQQVRDWRGACWAGVGGGCSHLPSWLTNRRVFPRRPLASANTARGHCRRHRL